LRRLLEAEHIDTAARDRLISILTDDICPDTDFIASAAEQMSRLLEGLKHLAAVGHVAVNIEPVDMNDVVGDIVGSMKFQIEQANAVVNVGSLPPCLADQGQIRQVFANILGNAVKYLDHGRAGIVEVRGHVRQGMSVYCVEDNGIGISAEHRDKVFDIFHRVGVKENIEGEGLGLSIVVKILERLGGAVRLESEPGEGSRFFVSLPTAGITEVAQTT
jgi:signal transduction histidine kinase